jgi:HK97 family phage portal protein
MKIPYPKVNIENGHVKAGIANIDVRFKGRAWVSPSIDDESAWGGGDTWGESRFQALNEPSIQLKYYNSWGYICINYNAKQISRQKLKLYVTKKVGSASFKNTLTRKLSTKEVAWVKENRGLQRWVAKDVEIEEVLEHPFLEMMKAINPLQNQADMWMLTETFMGITGNCYWWMRPNNLGIPYQLWILETQRTVPVPGTSIDNYVAGYVHRIGMKDIPFDADEVVHHKYPNPHTKLVGLSPMQALQDPLVINDEMYRYERGVFANMARPDGVLETQDDEVLAKTTFNKIKKEWNQTYGGAAQAGKVALLEGGVKYKQISMKPKDLGHLEGRKLTREEIAGGYGVPMALLTPDKVNLANARIAYVQYMRDTIDPKLKVYEQKINEQLLIRYEDENIFCAFDDCIPGDREFALKEREANLKSGYSVINELRKEDGKEPHEEYGDMPIMGSNMVEFDPNAEPEPKVPLLPPKPEEEEEEEEGKLAKRIAKEIFERL